MVEGAKQVSNVVERGNIGADNSQVFVSLGDFNNNNNNRQNTVNNNKTVNSNKIGNSCIVRNSGSTDNVLDVIISDCVGMSPDNIPPTEAASDGYRIQHRRRRTRALRSKNESPTDRGRYCSSVDGMVRVEKPKEIIISNVCEGTDEQRADVAYAILSTILPSIARNDTFTSI